MLALPSRDVGAARSAFRACYYLLKDGHADDSLKRESHTCHAALQNEQKLQRKHEAACYRRMFPQ